MPAIDFSLQCASCRHDLLGTDAAENCPVCARPVADTLAFVRVDPAAMAVCRDVSCIKCGYNLRTLEIGSICPECATPVRRSLRSDLLRFADTGWLRRVRRGVTWLIVALLAIPVVPPIVVIVAGSWLGGHGDIFAFWLFVVEVVTIVTIVDLPWCLGVFDATSAEPGPCGCTESAVPRIAARGCTLASFILPVLVFLVPAKNSFPELTFKAFFWMMPVFGTLAIACVGVCLRRLARRARRPGLGRLLTVLIGLVLAGGVLNVVYPVGMFGVTSTAGAIVCLLVLACYVIGLVVLFQCCWMLTAALVNRNGWRTIANDSPRCKKCGCNLTGNTSGNCPECGAESADSAAAKR